MRKTFLIISEILLLIIVGLVLFITGYVMYSFISNKVPFNINKISENALNIKVFNAQGLELKEYNNFNTETVSLDILPDYTKNAFISIEDKEFYNHKGINLKRIAKAGLKNISSLSLKEGASTITQQLIKNTYLTNEKTFSRKINEIKLALEVEKNMTKDEILQNYLNVIYFGNNCYGIENASKYYFSKPASNLTLNESASLAGLIKSPNYYSFIKHPDRAKERRNLVLKNMLEDGYINNIEYINNQNKDLELNVSSKRKNKLNSYSQSAIDEAINILKIPERQIAIGGYKIYTYLDQDKQNALQETLQNAEINNDYALIDIDSKTGGVVAYTGASDYKILEQKRQIGSIAKPLFVYTPAFNENILSPASLILDEPLQIGSYSPQNVNGQYLGYVDTRYALSKSLNIPAVKTASYVGINKIGSYAEKLHLPLTDNDYSYSIALGGLTYGYNLKDLAGAYSVFTNNGNYVAPRFIHYITDSKDNIIYKNNISYENVFRDDAAYLTTDILKSCAKNGTARKLAELNLPIASKTGTVGNKNGNTDAYNISYTTEDIVGIWFGNLDNSYINTTGGNQPTTIVKNYLKEIYKTHKPKDFDKPNSIVNLSIDTQEQTQNHQIILASSLTPEKFKKEEIFSKFNIPKLPSSPSLLKNLKLTGHVENNKAVLNFTTQDYAVYSLYQIKNGKEKLLQTFSNQTGNISYTIDLLKNQKSDFYVIVTLNDNTTQKSNIVSLINAENNIKTKWYI